MEGTRSASCVINATVTCNFERSQVAGRQLLTALAPTRPMDRARLFTSSITNAETIFNDYALCVLCLTGPLHFHRPT